MKKREKVRVGDELYLVEKKKRDYVEVVRVGRKYFSVESGDWRGRIDFEIATWKRRERDFGWGMSLYVSKEEYENLRERVKWVDLFADAFTCGGRRGEGFTLEQLRSAAKELGLELEEKGGGR